MAFCRFCGKKLADGEACTCEDALAQAANDAAQRAAAGISDAADTAAEQIDEVKDAVEDQTKDTAADTFDAIGAGIDQAKDKITQGAASAVNGMAGFFQKNKGIALIAGIACALILCIVVFVSLFGKKYMKPIDSLVKEINRGQKTDYISLINAGLPKDLAKVNKIFYGKVKADSTEDKDDDLKDAFEDLEDEFSKWKIEFEDDKIEKLSQRELEKYQDQYEDADNIEDILDELEDDLDDAIEEYAKWYDADEDDVEEYFKAMIKYLKGFKKIKITKGYKVKGSYILYDKGEKVNKTNKVTLYVLKFNGNWVVFGSKDNEQFMFDSGEDGYKETRFLSEFINGFYSTKFIPGF